MHLSRALRLEAEGFESLFDGLTARQIAALAKREAYHEVWEREDQRVPLGWWEVWQLGGGRGGGKTHPAAKWINDRAEEGKGPIVLIAGTAGDVRVVMVEGPSGILATARPGFVPKWEPSIGDGGLLTWPNGVLGLAFGSEAGSRVRGKGIQTCWCDDLSIWSRTRARLTFMQAYLGLREGDGRMVVTYNPDEDLDILVWLMEDTKIATVRTHSTAEDNLENLTLAMLDKKVALEGMDELIPDWAGGRLNKDDRSPFHGLKFDAPPIRVGLVDRSTFEEVVVVVDPSEGARPTSDEAGILVMARDNAGHVYVLEDQSGCVDPEIWGDRAISLAAGWQADCFVAETNRGLAQVKANLTASYYRDRAANGQQGLGALPPIVGVCAMNGKTLRALPVRTLYVEGRLHHVPRLPELEAQMRKWNPLGPKKPRQDDRIDALVHGATHLAGLNDDKKKPVPRGNFRMPGMV